MNILLANLTYLPHIGGIENSFRHISEIYKKQGHKVVIVCSNVVSDKTGKLDSFEIINGIEVHRYNRYHPKFKFLKPFVNVTDIIKSYFLVRKLDLKYNFDFSIVRNMKVGIGVKFALKTKPVIYVLSSITKFLDKKSLNNFKGNYIIKFIKWFYYNKIIIGQDVFFEKYLLIKSNLNVVFSKNMLNQVNQLIKIDNRKIKLITPGVDSKRFFKTKDVVIDKLNSQIKSDDFVFLLLGRLIKVKGVDVAIKAFGQLKYPLAKFLIVGDGPELINLKKLVKKMFLEEKVFFLPKTSMPENYFSISDAFLMTSSYESFGQTILEAMSSELPVVGFKSDGVYIKTATDEIIEDNINGFLCNYSIENLASAMNKIASLSIIERHRMGERSRCKIENEYSWKFFCNSILELELIKKLNK